MEAAHPKAKRKRNCPNGRVKTGCITCKIRRVKCDEGKPDCERCTSTGRKCDGYTNPTSKPATGVVARSRLSLVLASPTSSHSNPIDRRAFDFFRDRVAPRLSGFLEDDKFWNRIALQLSSHEPAVTSALLAVSAVYEECERGNGNPAFQNAPFALQSYNRAIRHFVEDTNNREVRMHTHLMVCALFTCIEFMRGDHSAAASHIRSGCMLADALKPTHPLGHLSPYSSSSPIRGDSSELTVELSRVFERLRLQSTFFDRTGSLSKPPKLEDLQDRLLGFSSLSDARSRLYELSNAAVDQIAFALGYRNAENATMEQIIVQVQLESRFQQWLQMFGALFSLNRTCWTPCQIRAANVLFVNGFVMFIFISTCLETEEIAFDRFHTQFETIVELATEAIEASDLSSTGPFHFDMGIIPSLQFVGSKCRYPLLRRRTLKILRSSRWREGLFDSHRAYRLIHAIMLAEEADLPHSALGISDENMHNGLPAETSRVHQADLWPFEAGDSRQGLTLVFKPNGPLGSPVRLDTWIATSGELPPLEPWCLRI